MIDREKIDVLELVRTKKPLVFLVEDNHAYRMVISRILQKNGCIVMVFENGQKAADMIKYVRPNLIISDIEMPVMDGFKFCQHVRSNESNQDIPFIFISSTTSKQMIAKANELGTINMLSKPISIEKLKNIVNTMLTIRA